jgi:hypothetical protein
MEVKFQNEKFHQLFTLHSSLKELHVEGGFSEGDIKVCW